MKSFLKTLLAVIVGMCISMIIIFFLFIGILSGIVASSSKEIVTISPKTVLKLTFDKPIIERNTNDPLENLNFFGVGKEKSVGLKEIIENLEKAKNDPNINGIYLELSEIPSGLSTIKEVRDALLEFKQSGKFVYAYGNYLTQKAYYLASVADKIYLNPQGSIEWKGLRSEVLFFKGTLQKLGIEAEIIRHGKYKSAVEPFSNDKMSNENKEQIQQLTSSIWKQMVAEIAVSRNIEEKRLLKIADQLSALNPDSCLLSGLVDSLLYKDQMDMLIAEKLDIENKDLKFVELAKYQKVPKPISGKGLAKNKIAIVYASGDVVMGNEDEGTVASERISKAIFDARTDTSVKAIVLRINSPGGSALASEIIWREVKLASQVKPVVASFGDVAASGGYYIACAANMIVAQPTTITGSIGVFGIMFNVRKLMNDKLGITSDGTKTNQYSDFPSVYRPMDNFEKQVMQNEIERIYTTFIDHVSEGRRMDKNIVDKIAQGRVWSGIDAKNINIVDTLGTFTTAITIAAKLAGIEHYRLIHLPKLMDPFEKLIKDLSEGTEARWIQTLMPEVFNTIKYYKSLSKDQGIQTRLPFELVIY